MTRRRAISLSAQGVAFLAGVAFLTVLPHWLSDFRASQVAYVGVYFIAIMGLNILTGYTGQISLGHGAFMAIGGYTTAILTVDHGVGELWTVPSPGSSPAEPGSSSACRRCGSPACTWPSPPSAWRSQRRRS